MTGLHTFPGVDGRAASDSPARRQPAEYYPALLKAIADLDLDHARKARRAIYDRARDLLFSQMCSATPSLSDDEMKQARSALEQALANVEAMVRGPDWPTIRLQYRPPPPIPVPIVAEVASPRQDRLIEPQPPVAREAPPAKLSQPSRAPQRIQPLQPVESLQPVEPLPPSRRRRTGPGALMAIGAATATICVLVYMGATFDMAATFDRGTSAVVTPPPIGSPQSGTAEPTDPASPVGETRPADVLDARSQAV